MSAYFEQGFSVREPMWHGLGEVLNDYPGRDEAMRLAGHDFEVVERPIFLPASAVEEQSDEPVKYEPVKGWKALVKDNDDTLLNVAKQSYGVVQNSVGWDIVDAMVGEGAKYETGITLKGGAVCSVLAWLDEPILIPGDHSPILPWVNVSWTHDGSGAVSSRATSIRTVCWNTQSAAEAQGKDLGTDYTFRHSKNVMAHIEDAKLALQGVRDSHLAYAELARELAEVPVTAEQRELFVTQFIPMPPEALISERVMGNVEGARTGLRNLFEGETIPDEHRLTAYGMHLAGGEYLDHLRGYRNRETYFGRSMLRSEPAKVKLGRLIKDVVAS